MGHGSPNRFAGTRCGLTLMESTIVMSIIAIVIGAVMILQIQGIRLYRDVAATNWANFDAATAVGIIEEDVQGCFRVTGRYSNRITISRPKLEWDSGVGSYLPKQPLGFGNEVRYYLADATGQIGTSGGFLWRSVRAAGTSSFVLDRDPLSKDISTLQFTYYMLPSPRSSSVAKVDLLVQASVTQSGATHDRTHTSEIVLRNASYGPVTKEPGVDDPTVDE